MGRSFGYLALTTAILKGWDAETTFEMAEPSTPGRRSKYSLEQVQEMARLRETRVPYKAIGEQFGCDGKNVYYHLQKHGLLVKGIIGQKNLKEAR